MATSIDALRMRRVLGREEWKPPQEHGPDGWITSRYDGTYSVIVTAFDWEGVEYVHASIAGHPAMPTYDDLTVLHRAVFGDGYAYQMFVPRSKHVDIHPTALHLWGRRDGKRVLPEFGIEGTI